jgi:hypothetical protein
MLSTSLTRQSPMIASESLIRVASRDICSPDYESGAPRCASLGVKWIVVTDTNGNRRPQMSWWSK